LGGVFDWDEERAIGHYHQRQLVMNPMNSTATNLSGPRRLPVQWAEEAPHWTLLFCRGQAGARRRGFRWGVCAPRTSGRTGVLAHFQRSRAFTLLELMMVIAIIGFVAAMALPHLAGFNKANTIISANRQILDDLAYARQRALANRSTVYMVFVPPEFWTNTVYEQSSNIMARSSRVNPSYQFTPMIGRQYTSYALMALSSVGDQPGRHYAHYLTDWRTLPQGVFFSQFQFNSDPASSRYARTISTTNTSTGATNAAAVYPLPWTPPVPFPSVSSGTSNTLPFIGFSPNGSLTEETDQYIVLTRGSVFYAQNSNGVPVAGPVDVVASPPGNETNNPNMIRIDWLTSRATVLQNQF
jgi:prepilin-type N-terminal cleavage/methylation domain-containing protein